MPHIFQKMYHQGLLAKSRCAAVALCVWALSILFLTADAQVANTNTGSVAALIATPGGDVGTNTGHRGTGTFTGCTITDSDAQTNTGTVKIRVL